MEAQARTEQGGEVPRSDHDDDLMARALRASSGTWPHPNPRVGAVVVAADGTILAERSHAIPGTPHAEVLALTDAGERARGGTLVVTLEPCNHYGRTPPCTDAIVGAGISRVVVGATDPDPRVAGSGIQQLRTVGIEVVTGIADDAVVAADPGYFHHRRTGLPRVTLKLAATLDGQVAAVDGTSQWITGSEARRDVHRLRSTADAVAVGAGTVLTDDPQLDVRLDSYGGPQPRPVIVAGTRVLPDDRQILARTPLVYSPRPIDIPHTAEVVEVGGDSRVDLAGLLKDLGTRGILTLLVEGGPTLAASFAALGLVDEYVLYLGHRFGLGVGRPMFDGLFETIGAAQDVAIVDVAQLGGDVRIRALPREPSR